MVAGKVWLFPNDAPAAAVSDLMIRNRGVN